MSIDAEPCVVSSSSSLLLRDTRLGRRGALTLGGARRGDSRSSDDDDWSDEYEAHMRSIGYTHPAMVAALAAQHIPEGATPILDAGCGTGIMSEIMQALDHDEIVGLDASPGMLKIAAEKGHYSDLHHMYLGEPLDFADDTFQGVVSSGVFTQGHAPLSGLDELIRVTAPGGHIAFSVARTYLEGEFGINGLCVGVPVKLGAGGMEQVMEIKLTPEEQTALQGSAASVQELVDIMNKAKSE